MNAVLLDNLVFFFALVYYAFLFLVYLLRAQELTKLELKLSPVLPIVIYLVYDLWYRLITRKKPYHHPDRWPLGLVVYLLLLFVGSIGLNWYGYLVSTLYGNTLIIAFFVMISSYGYYQYTYNKRKEAKDSFTEG